jgi:hypothetical protein
MASWAVLLGIFTRRLFGKLYSGRVL